MTDEEVNRSGSMGSHANPRPEPTKKDDGCGARTDPECFRGGSGKSLEYGRG